MSIVLILTLLIAITPELDRAYADETYFEGEVIQVSAGIYHGLALMYDGTVYSWGYNYYGQLGIGTEGSGSSKSRPVKVPGITNAIKVIAGYNQSYAILSDGRVMAWGQNTSGAYSLGVSPYTNRLTPVEITSLTGKGVVDISIGNFQRLALTSSGEVYGWGQNEQGQLGLGHTDVNVNSPTKMLNIETAVSVSSSHSHSLVALADGTVMACGQNYYGELGDGTTTRRTTPVKVSTLTDVVEVVAGSYVSLARSSNGTLQAWGYNMGSNPTLVSGINGATAIGTIKFTTYNNYRFYALLGDNTLKSWIRTDGIYAQIEANNVKDFSVAGLGSYVWGVGLILDTEGLVLASGRQDNGALGNGLNNSTYVSTPEVIISPAPKVEVNSTSVNIYWDRVVRATSYDVYRNGALLGTTHVNSMVDSGLTPGKQYTYKVQAYYTEG